MFERAVLDQELEVSLRARRSAFVIDPLLALSTPLGARLTGRLSAAADLWVTRTFWQVIDSSDYYRRDPPALWPEALRAGLPESIGEDLHRALSLWETTRLRTDLTHCRLHWVSDNLGESVFPDGAPPDLIERYEALHQSLTARADPGDDATGTAGFYGTIDSLALAAALGNASLLTLAPDAPTSCLGLACAQVGLGLEPAPDGDDPDLSALAALERQRLREMIVAAGCTPLLWGGLRLAVVHPLLCGDPGGRLEHFDQSFIDSPLIDPVSMDSALDEHGGAGFDFLAPCPAVLAAGDPWRSARHFWQRI